MARETEEQRNIRLIECQRELAGEHLVAGIDEAGRGPLAGPVYAACVIMDEQNPILGVNDSKKIAEKKRERIAGLIKEQAVAYGVGWATVDEIEQYNILNATRMAMRRAWQAMNVPNAYVLMDGMDPIDIGAEGEPVTGGDAKCYSIAAASILAKTERDKVLRRMDEQYPEYGFAKHKGYGTQQHIDAILKHGVCEAHRMSFLGKILQK